MPTPYQSACARAASRSAMFQCTVHVNAVVALVHGTPTITSYDVSDWFVGGSTVATYTNGTRD